MPHIGLDRKQLHPANASKWFTPRHHQLRFMYTDVVSIAVHLKKQLSHSCPHQDGQLVPQLSLMVDLEAQLSPPHPRSDAVSTATSSDLLVGLEGGQHDVEDPEEDQEHGACRCCCARAAQLALAKEV